MKAFLKGFRSSEVGGVANLSQFEDLESDWNTILGPDGGLRAWRLGLETAQSACALPRTDVW